MKVDPAIDEAIDACLNDADYQTDDFKRRFRALIVLALDGNTKDSDTRRVMELVSVEAEDEL